jgi:hypothetical protein
MEREVRQDGERGVVAARTVYDRDEGVDVAGRVEVPLAKLVIV